MPSSKAAASEGPEAYPLGYVEDLNDARTTLAGFFSILLKISAITVPNLSRHIVELRQMHDSFGNFIS
jgi:hypothetical protein